MTTFWIIAAAMTLAAVATVAPAVLRKRSSGKALNRDRQNIAIARERLAELETDRAAGDIADETYQQVRAELENTLADDIAGDEQVQPAAASGGRWALALLLVAIPLVAFGLYLQIGAPQLVTVSGPGAQISEGPHGAGDATELPPVDQLADMLAEKLKQNPENPDGWYLLGRTYMSMQRYQDAANAFEQLHGLVGDDPAVLLALADSLAMAQGARMSGRPAELALKALEQEPENTTALWLAGKGAAETGQYLEAIRHWRKVEAQVQDDPQILAEIRSLIAEAQQQGNIPDDQMPPAPAPAAAEPAASAAAITVSVALDPAMAAQATPDDTVFIFARAIEGPPMPLAVARHQVKDLPITVTLTDEMAMMPQSRLSNFAQVRVSARVSKSGNAIQQSGDLVSDGTDVEVAGAEPVSLVINSVVP